MPEPEFDLDDFQIEAADALRAGSSVLVCAPTGAGKTVVAEQAIELALAQDGRVFYTTPIKALSNQKYHDLALELGAEQVGLLTGDNAINGNAPVVVMTTEVLRNMIYASSASLHSLHYVVLDEVHYLQDAYRGPVWEEVIIHLPEHVKVVALSATVSNADELASWIDMIRPPVATVIETRRPVELDHHFLLGDRQRGELTMMPTLVDGEPNPRGEQSERSERPGPQRERGRRRRRFFTPRRPEVTELLAGQGLLPAIVFVFSRAGCDDAVTAVRLAGLELTTGTERAVIAQIVEQHTRHLSQDDLEALGYADFQAGLLAGVAAHHAGMIPPFKEAVEACFLEGLTKVVFATETLALGINMPARTVVVEKLTKFTGERHESLTPAQFTQLTGRAGRRGIDDRGTAVVLWTPWSSFGDVAALAMSTQFRLTSSFKPTYNMAANLVRLYRSDEALHLLNRSFAQFQTDRSVVRLEARLAKRQRKLARLEDEATCERGDVSAYRRALDAQRRSRQTTERRRREQTQLDLRRLVPGDVVRLSTPGISEPVAVLSVSERKAGAVRLRVVDRRGNATGIGSSAIDAPPVRLATVMLPEPFAPRQAGFQADVAERLGKALAAQAWQDPAAGESSGSDRDATPDRGVGSCPELEVHLRAASKVERVQREVDNLNRRIERQTDTLSRQFDRVLSLLRSRGFIRGWRLSTKGERLVQIFHECDVVIAEALEVGLLDDLDPASTAAVLSCLTYEHRSPEPPPPPWFPSPEVERACDGLVRIAEELRAAEQEEHLALTRLPDPSFVPIAHAWAAGDDLSDVLDDDLMTAGDFVRNVKQLVDLAGQVALAAPDAEVATAARGAAGAMRRGVIAHDPVVEDVGP